MTKSQIGQDNKQIIISSLGTKIKDIKFPEEQNGVISLLAYLYGILGIKGEKLPTSQETYLIIDFMRSQLGSYSIDDFKIAFQLAIAGKLGIDANAYQNFSCEYLGKIMAAYQKHRLPILADYRRIENESEKIMTENKNLQMAKKISYDFLLECIVKPWKYYLKTGTLTFGVHPNHILYKTLSDELGLIKLTNEEKFEIWNRAKELSKDEVYKQTFNATEINKIKFLKDQIRLIGYDKAMDSTIRNIAYDISIKETFAKFKSDNFDVEQYILDWIKKDSNE